MGVDAILMDSWTAPWSTRPPTWPASSTPFCCTATSRPYPFAIARNEVSNGALGLLRLGFPDCADNGEIEPLRQEFLDIYTKNVCVKSRLFIGLETILTNLYDKSIPWGIVTNKPHAMTSRLLEALALPYPPSCVVSGDQLPQRKPHPAPLYLGADELGIDAGRCVYVGDARRDIDAGRAAGMATVAAAYGYMSRRRRSQPVGRIRRHPGVPANSCGAVTRLQ